MEPIIIEINKDPRRIDLEGPILVAHQPEFLPWLGNISKAAMGDVYLFFDDDQFKKKTFQNRNRIRAKNDLGYQWLTIPLKKANSSIMSQDSIIMESGDWRRKHLKTIMLAYAKAPYFDDVFPFIKKLYENKSEDLVNFLLPISLYAFEVLGVAVPIYRTSKLKELGYQIQGNTIDKILSMCHIFDAKTLVVGISGKEYLDIDKIKQTGIQVVTQKFTHPIYKQIHGEFVPNMSFLDLLFNHGPDATKILGKSNYQLG